MKKTSNIQKKQQKPSTFKSKIKHLSPLKEQIQEPLTSKNKNKSL
jgi:hypothetical protein